MPLSSSIFTDENAIKFTVWLICGLGSIIIVLGGLLINRIFSEVKASRNERSEFTNALNHKFKALNAYVKGHDRTAIIHGEKITNLFNETQEYKKKTDQHAIILSKHESDIDNLKRK